MNAMIFAAGLGTRLRPLTDNMPKALVEFRGKPLLWHAIQNVIGVGVERIVVNVHHHADQIINYLNNNSWDVDIVISDETGQLLETGGGLLKAKSFFIPNKTILVQNSDIIVKTDLNAFVNSHFSRKTDITLMVKKRPTNRYLLFDEELHLVGWENTKTGEVIQVMPSNHKEQLGFCGIHLLEPHILNKMGEIRPFSIINTYLELAKTENVFGYKIAEEDKWFDLGTIDKLYEAERKY